MMHRTHTLPASTRRRSAFTLVEMLVAVAAVGIIAVGLGRLFQRTGDTVKRGRQISRLNEAATVLERTMREDFSRMSPEGFLVIKNVLTPNTVLLGKDDQTPEEFTPVRQDLPKPRQRRVDQIVFFREGRFVSKAIPKDPKDYAVGSAARIYYGHGLPMQLDPNNNNAYHPNVEDTNVAAPYFGEPGPSQYASNWILMRHETVLCPPRLTQFRPQLSDLDSRTQIAQRSAAVDVFGIIAKNYKLATRPKSGDNADSNNPVISSGIVDVAATDLSQVRARVLNAQPLNVQHLEKVKFELEDINPNPDNPTVNPYTNRPMAMSSSGRLSFVLQDPTLINNQNDALSPTTPVPTAARMKHFMIQGLPGDEPSDLEADNRMRCEPQPPDLNGLTLPNMSIPTADRSDQMMLSASNLVVGCSEFIVEWSYGVRYPSQPKDSSDIRMVGVHRALAGQLIWHGLPRLANINGNESTERDEYVAHPYNSVEPSMRINSSLNNLGVQPLQTQEYFGVESNPPAFPRIGGDKLKRHIYQSPLIHEPLDPSWDTRWRFPEWTNWDFVSNRVLCSCFGYVDPTYGHGIVGLQPETIPVPRPKLIRVTVGLVDPTDPLNEHRFQFIFELPENGDAIPGS